MLALVLPQLQSVAASSLRSSGGDSGSSSLWLWLGPLLGVLVLALVGGTAAGAFLFVRARRRRSEGRYNPAQMETRPGKKTKERTSFIQNLNKVFLYQSSCRDCIFTAYLCKIAIIVIYRRNFKKTSGSPTASKSGKTHIGWTATDSVLISICDKSNVSS